METAYGIQKMHDIYAPMPGQPGVQGLYPVTGAYCPIRAYLNPRPDGETGNYFQGQLNGYGYTHGCLCYGTDTSFINYMWNNMGNTRVGVSVNTPVTAP